MLKFYLIAQSIIVFIYKIQLDYKYLKDYIINEIKTNFKLNSFIK